MSVLVVNSNATTRPTTGSSVSISPKTLNGAGKGPRQNKGVDLNASSAATPSRVPPGLKTVGCD